MRFRPSFVSNSSSSSFIVVTTLENWNAIVDGLHPLGRDVAQTLQCGGGDFLGQDVVCFGSASGHDEWWGEYLEPSCPEGTEVPEKYGDSGGYDVVAIWEDVVAAITAAGPILKQRISG